jgi:hypothetical protein
MDDCPSYAQEKVMNLFLDARVGAITWAPHATDILQEIDVSLFGRLKRRE